MRENLNNFNELLKKLPVLSGLVFAIITGIIGNLAGRTMLFNTITVLFSFLLFFIIGIYAKRTINDILEETQKKEKQENFNKEHSLK